MFSACGTLQTKEPLSAPPTPAVTITPIPLEQQGPDGRLLAAVCEQMHFTKQLPITAELLGKAAYRSRQFALVGIQNDTYGCYLVEYAEAEDGYEILAWHAGAGNDANAVTCGYWPMYADFGGTKLCWVRITDTRTATSDDGAAILNDRCKHDYTAIRFTLSDGSVKDVPITDRLTENRLLLQIFKDEWPVSAMPLTETAAITVFEMPAVTTDTAQTA